VAEEDKEFVEYVVKAIVDNPGDVKTNRRVDEMGVLIELEVNPADMGKVIGKEGKTAKALRTLLRVMGAKNNARINLKIIEPEGGREMAPVGKEEKEAPAEEEKAKEKPEEKPEAGGEEKATEII